MMRVSDTEFSMIMIQSFFLSEFSFTDQISEATILAKIFGKG